MKLSEYLKDLNEKTSILGERNARQPAVLPVEMQTELDRFIDGNLKTNVLGFLNTHPESPFHELMAVEFLLAKINFSSQIAQELNDIKTDIAQTIQNLYYLLEKPHPETASSGYNERRRAQEDYIKKAIMADRGRGEKDDPLMLLALEYCLDNMDDDTYIYLTKDLPISDEKVTRRSSLAKLQGKLLDFALSGQPDPKYFAALATLEFYRVSPAHLTEEKHAAKNQRFYQEIIRLIDNNPSEAKADSNSGISPPRPGFSNESSSVLSEDGESMRQTKPLSIQTVRASDMVFHFSASLPQSSIDLLAEIQVPTTPRQLAVVSADDVKQYSELLRRESELDDQYLLLELARTPESERPSSHSDPVTPLQTEEDLGSSQTQPLLVSVDLPEDESSISPGTNKSNGDIWRSVPSAASPNHDATFSPDITARLSPTPSAHAVEDTYEVPPSGNCCYSSIIVALMHGFFSGSIKESGPTANALNMQNDLFDKIEKTIGDKLGSDQSIIKKFEFLLTQYKNNELFLLETIMVPALRKVIAEYALATEEDERNELCVRCFEGQEQQHQEKFVRYFSALQALKDGQTFWGGPADLAVVERMYRVRITDSVGPELLERSDEEMTRPHLIIHHMRDTAQQDHYEVLLTGDHAPQVKSFCDAVMETYEQDKNDWQLALKVAAPKQLKTPSRSWRDQERKPLSSGKSGLSMFGSNRSQRSSASRQLSTGSTLSVTSLPSVEGSVSVRQQSKSVNFTNFKQAMTQYYDDPNNRKDNLKALVNIVTSLSDSKNGIVVYAPVAIAALKEHAALDEHAYQCMDDIYAHLYIVLHSIVFATSTTAALTNLHISRKAVEAKKDAATILEWLSNPQDDKLVSALTEVHARMLDKECSAEDTSVVQMVSWRDQSRCSNRHNQSCLANPSPDIDAAVLTILRGLPFMWSSLYTNGAHETNHRIIEERRYYEVIAAYALQDILNDSLRNPLSMEEQWLILKAIADYNKVRAYQKNHPKSRLLAESPFFNAIRLLAVTCPLASTDASAQIREQELCQHLYERAVPSLFRYEGELLRQQKLLQEEVVELTSTVENSIEPVSISVKQGGSSEAPSVQSSPAERSVVRRLSYDNHQETNTESVGSNTPGAIFSTSCWSVLYKEHCTDGRDRNAAASLTDDEIKFILNNFDRKCKKASGNEKNKLLELLKKAFGQMQQIFQDPNNQQRTSFSMFSFGRRESSPINFNSFMDCIAPKGSLPPYAFAQYCAYQSSRIHCGHPEITHLLPHEENFIRKHLVSLYDNKDKLNEMFDKLGDNVVTSTKTSAIRMIYDALDLEISALEARNNVTPEEVKPYYKMIFSKKNDRLCDMDTKKKKDSNISHRINFLYTKSNSTPTHSKK
ncbi:MAG: hypothetical protein KBD83_00245 [Gammaproteobacteria bacterium]|nr:hypothetical protein [Gammaproteobacteria bacterium]